MAQQKYKFKVGELVRLKNNTSIPRNLQGQMGIITRAHEAGLWRTNDILTSNEKLAAYTIHLAIEQDYYYDILWNEDEIEKVKT